MSHHQPVLSFALVLMLLPLVSPAQDLQRAAPADKSDPEVVFAYQGDAVLTQDGIDAAFRRIPEEDRLTFIRDGGQVDRMVRNIMKTEVIALDAIRNGFADDPIIRELMIQSANKILAEAWIDQLLENAPEADYEAMALEDYLAHPQNYQTEEFLDVTHILVGTETRSDEEALALAQDLRQRVLDAPGSMTELVMEYSDDPAKSGNEGKYLRIGRGQTAQPFEDAAFALQDDGDVSGPVRTDFGYHVIRLDKRYPPKQLAFEDVHEEAVLEMKQRHQAKYQETYIRRLLAEGIVLPEGSVEIMLRRHFGDDLENAPQFRQD